MRVLAIGAEAEILEEGSRVIKNRLPKRYRLPLLDERLRGMRTRREAKVLGTLSGIVPVPRLLRCDGKSVLEIELVPGELVRDALSRETVGVLSEAIGRQAAFMHDRSVIHGDLTTSNMILAEDQKVYFIDFGLSFFSEKEEDKAVDLHLLRQSLMAAHAGIGQPCFERAAEAYRAHSANGERVLQRLEKVAARGRYKGKQQK